MNKSKHLSVEFCRSDGVSKLVNDPRFLSLDEFEDDCFEVDILLLVKLSSVCVYVRVCVCECVCVCVCV